MSPARGRTALTVRLLGLGSLAMTLSNETLPFVLEGVQTSPATWPGMVGLLASQLGAGLALLRRRSHRTMPWVLLALLLGGL